ncbi:adenylate/guanylate cyclase domain-containing protein [Variovorax sp. J22R133]|uniref:adenylate/guanylate cyclase domain-containing protein n=1 Tax=Variovorax brevis TaxID=3053503 RepID=UPI002577C5DF|nr:adenylate/guanylate cyclase domain-containing protein [Variovorax sp. J22R133]MDM0114367.1 adenylate/guanylate cyclase domain-containing protein [Variovorax sp. J22R133]
MTESGFRQRLMAILSADGVGYSRLMAADAHATVAGLEAARARFRMGIEANQGRVIDMAGDSVLAVFESAIGAVSAALAVQRELDDACHAMPEDRQMRFRIGIHLGDVIEKDDGSIYGDGVNIAARLQTLAEAGGIMVSDAVQGAVRGRLAANFVDQGEQQIKNIPQPVRAFAIRAVDSATPQAGTSTLERLSRPGILSLAVLPFTNMSGDPEQDYFADGMVEDIISALARMRWLFVIARNSSFVYKGKAVDIKQVGRELGARYILEGSVRKSGNRVRVTGQLIEAESGHHVWSERFEGTLADVFELQDRIAEGIVSAMEPSMLRTEVQRARAKPKASLQAHDLLLRAHAGLMPGMSGAARDEAMSFIRLALEKDPHYALANALGAFACMERVIDARAKAHDVKAGLRYAEEALLNANDDPRVLSYAGATLGTLGYRVKGVRVLGFRYDEAERAIERALSLCPNLLAAQFCAGNVRNILGDGDAALGHFQRAMQISPLDPGTSGFIACVGAAHFVAGRYDEALKFVQRSIQDSPKYVYAHLLMLLALGRMERMDEARVAAQRLLELAPELTASRYQSFSPMKDPAFRKRNAEILRAAGVPE